MSVWRRLGEEIARVEDAALADGVGVARARARFLDGAGRASTGGTPARRWALGLGLAAAAAAVVAVVTLAPWRDSSSLVATDAATRRSLGPGEWVSAPADEPRRIAFSDGSSVALEPASGARVVSLDPQGARLSLERGTARVAIRKRTGARWQVDVGPYAVSVTGTRFVVAWDPAAQLFSLTLEEGSVRVRGPLLGEGRVVAVDETLRAFVAEGRLEIRAGDEAPGADPEAAGAQPGGTAPTPAYAAENPAATTSSGAGPQPSPAGPATPAGGKPAPGWRALARAGDNRAAVDEAARQGIDSVLRGASAADLMLLGDAARLSRDLDLADRCYLAVRERFPGTADSAGAAFALGRLAFDHQFLYAKAAKWMDVYLAEGGEGAPLAREALGRLVEAEQRAGDLAGAKKAAERYLVRYPDGPHAALAREVAAAKDAPSVPAP